MVADVEGGRGAGFVSGGSHVDADHSADSGVIEARDDVGEAQAEGEGGGLHGDEGERPHEQCGGDDGGAGVSHDDAGSYGWPR